MTRESAVVRNVPARTRWIDGAKGIGILLVVYGHAARALYPTSSAPAWVTFVDKLIYAFHMPLFFVAAGLFVWPSLGKGRGRFVADKLSTIVYPYFLWSLIEGGLELAFANEVNSPIGTLELAMIPVAPIEQFWFLYVLALCLALALVCYPRRPAVAVVAAAGLAVVGHYGVATIAARSLLFFPYMAVGILVAAPILALGRYPGRAAILMVGAGIVFAAGLALGSNGVVWTFVIALAGTGATFAVAVLIDRSAAGAMLALLGRASLAIYVMHTIFSAGMRIVARAVGLAMPPTAMLAATMVAGVAGPLGAWLLAEHYGLSLPLGFGRTTRRREHVPSLFNGGAKRRAAR